METIKREIVYWYIIEGLNHKQIAEKLNISNYDELCKEIVKTTEIKYGPEYKTFKNWSK